MQIEFEGGISAETSARVIALFRHLHARVQELRIVNLHPAYTSLLVEFDPSLSEPAVFIKAIELEVLRAPMRDEQEAHGFEIPMRYGGEHGPDLESVAATLGLSSEDVVQLHASVIYSVAFLGFAPGFPYLLGLPEVLHVPRKSVPRLRVAAGSVAIASAQAGIYPQETPAGWQVLGRTQALLFDLSREPVCLLSPGDKLRFVPSPTDPVRLVPTLPQAKNLTSTTKGSSTSAAHALTHSLAGSDADLSEAKLLGIVESGGLLTTVQDLGRANKAAWGVSRGGAADLFAIEIANLLVGNEPGAAGLEIAVLDESISFAMSFRKDTWIAITGAECEASLDGLPIVRWSSLPVSRGQRLVVKGVRNGLRCYLSFHSGIKTKSVLGSQSTFVSGGWGGYEGRTLQNGDALFEHRFAQTHPGFRKFAGSQDLYSTRYLRATLGSQASWFDEATLETFFSSEFVVTNEANRLGLRLKGLSLVYRPEFQNQELTTEGVPYGSVQVTPSGTGMILFCEQQTTGGYPKIATIVRADWQKLGQLKPGDVICFRQVSFEEAWVLNQALVKLKSENLREV